MQLLTKLDQFHTRIRGNRWCLIFTIFTRIVLAAGFIPSGMVKILCERFTALSDLHPMGSYLEALHHTGYYYTFIGIAQVSTAILLLIPRTALLGVLIYFPIILNICILSFAVRFDGSLFTSPLMVLACLYLSFWDHHKLRPIFTRTTVIKSFPHWKELSWKFPFGFAGFVLVTIVGVVLATQTYDMYPRNTKLECENQCADKDDPEACMDFCDCIHVEGNSLDDCLEEYYLEER